MKKIFLIAISVFTYWGASAQTLEQSFLNPPESARPWAYWFWMGGHVTQYGITKDLEMMADVGIGGVLIMEVQHHKLPDVPVEYNSDEWRDLRKHAQDEANRLGIEVTSHNCAGWSATGGPWVTADKAMKILGSMETFVKSTGKLQHLVLPRPNKDREFYKDIAVMAFPAKKNTFKIKDWHLKGLHFDHAHIRIYRLPHDTRNVPADDVVQSRQMINLMGKMKPDGSIDIMLPEGEWVVLRMGYSNSPKINGPAVPSGRGFEIDKFDRSAVDLHWDATIEPLLKKTNRGDKGITALQIDSFEKCYQNWVDGFEKEFKARCGYDIEPWIPCLAGYVVESLDQSERFLWDFRKVCGELMADNYILYFKEKCNENNLKLMVETYGTGVYDGFEVAKIADVPMGEFWFRRPQAWHEWSTKLAASGAHLTGKNIVGAESFTSTGEDAAFHANPYALKPKGDYYFTEGLNRMIFHCSVHQPWHESVKPGMTMAPHGIQLHRNNTWVPKGRPYFEYLARCQYLLQQGRFVADFLYAYPTDHPNTNGRRENISPAIPAGYDYDVTNLETLKDLTVKNGRVVTSSGMSYRHIIVPYNRAHLQDEGNRAQGEELSFPQDAMRFAPETLAEIKRLVDSGASILAPRPVSAPGLANYPACDAQVERMAKALWDEGKILPPERIADMCRQLPPDFESSEINGIKYIHRNADGADMYFVANRELGERTITGTFRIQGKLPEFWNPMTGEIRPATNWRTTEDGRTDMVMKMSPADSVFVVFRKPTDQKSYNGIKPELRTFATLEGDWEVSFDPVYGPGKPVVFRYLEEWNNNDNPLIKYYSGSATYKKAFVVDDVDGRIYLDLGDVEFMARVKINGKDLGLLWKPPYMTEITGALRKGRNEIEIEVTNSWINRLIGDERIEGIDLSKVPAWLSEGKPYPDSLKRKTYVAHRHYNGKEKLEPSGLMGPVELKR